MKLGNIYYIDGRFVKEEDAGISVMDLAVLRGFAVFDYMVTYNGRPFHLREHAERLKKSADYIGLALNYSVDEICTITEETLKRNTDYEESGIRIVHTGGVSADGITPAGHGKLLVMITPRHKLPEKLYSEGAGIITVQAARVIPSVKSTNYISAIPALNEARRQGAVECIYVDERGRLLEGTTSNFFFFRRGKLITSGADILPGITRGVVLKLAGEHFDIEMRDILTEEIGGMDEVFISSSNREVLPIVRINNRTIGDGTPGKNTLKVMELFSEYTEKYGREQF